ncbi:MAG: ATP-grasp domain-containing protein [Eubacteriales bacterium]|nr:ATP-grasp domain-containing protein [Eubacteriales bacterium]
MNVLLTTVGRRAYMVKFFKEVIGDEGMVHATNSDDKTVAFHYADKSTITPLIYDENYIPFLLNYCKENKIDIVISLFDVDLPVLAKNRDKFEGIGASVIVSNEEIVDICNDKWKTYLFLEENGFNVPKTYLSLHQVMLAIENGEVSYPIVVKPRFGCGSIALSIAEDEMALLYYYSRNNRVINTTYLKYESAASDEKIIYQECLNGQEYGADIINDLDGNYRNVIVKKKVAMRAGETDIAEIKDVPVINKECEKLGKLTGHIANMDCDVFLVDGRPYILEMNARFGGGYPFSHMSGCNLPKAIVKWVKGEEVSDDLITAKKEITAHKELVITITDRG